MSKGVIFKYIDRNGDVVKAVALHSDQKPEFSNYRKVFLRILNDDDTSKENRDWEKELEEKRNQLLPFNTPVMVSEGDNYWCIRYYKKCRQCHVSKINSNGANWKYIVPVSKFDFEADDLSINIKNYI